MCAIWIHGLTLGLLRVVPSFGSRYVIWLHVIPIWVLIVCIIVLFVVHVFDWQWPQWIVCPSKGVERSYTMLKLFDEDVIFYPKRIIFIYYVMSKQLIKTSLVKLKLLNKPLLHYITHINTHTNWDNQCIIRRQLWGNILWCWFWMGCWYFILNLNTRDNWLYD